MLRVWKAPETTPKGGALCAPPFGMVTGAPRAVQTPKVYDFWVQGKYVFMIRLIRSWGYIHLQLSRWAVCRGRQEPENGTPRSRVAWEINNPPGPGHRRFLGSYRQLPAPKPTGNERGIPPPTLSGGFWGDEGTFGPRASTIPASGGRFCFPSRA